MNSYEVHEVRNEADLHLAELAGLTDGVDVDECANCWESVGTMDNGSFEPFVITITYKDEGYSICGDCADPVIGPYSDDE